MGGSQHAAAQHRRDGQRDYPRNQNRHTNRHCEFTEQATDHALHEHDRHEHDGQRGSHRNYGGENLLGPLNRGLQPVLAHFHMACDVLEHNNRVIDHKADRQRNCHQGQIIQAETDDMHDGERTKHGSRQHQRRHQGGAYIAQESENHRHDQEDRQHQREIHLVNRIANKFGTVDYHLD